MTSTSDEISAHDRWQLAFESHGVTLAGTLYVPAAAPPHPALVMLQGSGAADRDSAGYFPPIREAFLRRGIAVYSFDKPGIGGSSGDWRHYALFDRTDQAQAAVSMLKEQAALDPRRIGVWGHSQGAWIVQLFASRASDLAFAIANSGPGISPREQDIYGVEHTLLAEGKPAEYAERAVAFVNAVHEAATRGDDYSSVFSVLVQPAMKEPWYGYFKLDDAEEWGMMRRFMAEHYEPADALARIRCPFLAIFGELDPLLPAYKSAQICGQTLREAGNRDATIVIFPHGNHRILLPETGEFAPGYLDLVADWAAQRVMKTR
jgi:pimeloyl-ACP methyl ester carboxylesterase